MTTLTTERVETIISFCKSGLQIPDRQRDDIESALRELIAVRAIADRARELLCRWSSHHQSDIMNEDNPLDDTETFLNDPQKAVESELTSERLRAYHLEAENERLRGLVEALRGHEGDLITYPIKSALEGGV